MGNKALAHLPDRYQRPAEGGPAGCHACGYREVLHPPAAGDQRHAWYQAFGNLALARLQAIGVLGLAPPHPPSLSRHHPAWVQVLGRSLRRLTASAPSFPLVVACVVLCAWHPADSGPMLDSLAWWHYDAGDYGRLHPEDEPPRPLQSIYAMGLQCSSCRRFRAARVREASAPPPGAPRQGLFFIRLDSATRVTVEIPSWTVVQLGGVAQPGLHEWADCKAPGAKRRLRTQTPRGVCFVRASPAAWRRGAIAA